MELIILLSIIGVCGLYLALRFMDTDDIDGYPVDEDDPRGGRKST